MLEPAAATTPVRIAERIAVHSDSRPARFVSAATLLLVTGWLVLLVAHSGYLRHPDFDEIYGLSPCCSVSDSSREVSFSAGR